jgi:hypothetical protein
VVCNAVDESSKHKNLKTTYAIDSAATTNVFLSEDLLKNVHDQRTHYVTADGSKRTAAMVGVHPVFGFGVIEKEAQSTCFR